MRTLFIVLFSLPVLLNATDYPTWRGPAFNGSAPESGAKLISDLSKAKRLWTCEQELVEGYVGSGWGYRGSYAQPILADGKIFVPYWTPTGDTFQSVLHEQAQKKRIPDSHKIKERWFLDADDMLVCIDTRTGKVLWNTSCPGGINNSGDNPPPVHMAACYKDGKVYFSGTAGKANCLDATSGELLWQVDIPGARQYWLAIHAKCKENGKLPDKRRGGYAVCANPCIAGDVFVVHDTNGGLVGLSLSDGTTRWKTPKAVANKSSPVVWRHGGKDYIVACYGRDKSAVCIDSANGKILWRQADVRNSATPSLAGDVLLTGGGFDKIKHKYGQHKHGYEGYGMAAWKLTPTGCTKLWELPLTTRLANQAGITVLNGHAYANVSAFEPAKKKGDNAFICVDIAKGIIVSQTKGGTNAYASLIASDGVVIHNTGRQFIMYAANPAKVERLGDPLPFTAGDSVTPILVDGILYARGSSKLAAFDLRR